jgi:hypothetical protein
LLLFQRRHRRAHGRARGQTIIDQDHDLAAHVRSRAHSAVSAFTSLQFPLLSLGNRVDQPVRNIHLVHDVLVQHTDTACGNGAHRELLVTWYAQLAHHEHIQRRAERSRNFVGHWYPAPRQSEHQYVRAIRMPSKLR